jgi:mono/diheme cytochrome c family protein
MRLVMVAVAVALLQGAPQRAEAQDADWAPGERLTYINCGRCHVIGPRNRMGGIGSTPGIDVIRTWPTWEEKMRGFYALNPHPAFTQVEGVTAPFAEERPSPIHPITLTAAEIEIIVEYSRTVEPADLGAPIR